VRPQEPGAYPGVYPGRKGESGGKVGSPFRASPQDLESLEAEEKKKKSCAFYLFLKRGTGAGDARALLASPLYI